MDNNPVEFQKASQQLDACGLECPQPILICRQYLRQLQVNELLHVIADDPNSVLDFEVFCQRTGHQLIATHMPADGKLHFLIKKQNQSTA